MKHSSSIRQQTFVLLLGLTLGLTLVFSVLALLAAFVVEDLVLDNWLKEQAVYLEHYFAKQGRLPELSFQFIQVFTASEVLPAWMQAAVLSEPLAGEIFTDNETHYHYRQLNFGQGSGYLLAEVSTLLVVTQQTEIFSIFFAVFIAALLVAVGLAVQFSRRIVSPVVALSDAVKTNPVNNFQKYLPDLPRELAYLADRLQSSFDNMNELLKREKEFSTNVSHELRTPLTLLKNTTTLIAQRGLTESDLAIASRACEQMERTVDVLFSLARANSLPLEPCRLDWILESAVMQCQPWLARFQLHLQLPRSLTLLANAHLMELLFINLLRNAAEHASEPLLSITENEGTLIFENKVNHLPSLDITLSGARNKSSQGLGQGLYLVSRIASQFFWDFSVVINNEQFKVVIKLSNFT